MKFNILKQDVYTIEDCQENTNYLYVFGDNAERIGSGGQAQIRGCINTIGIATKKSIMEFMTDAEYANNQAIINRDIEAIKTKMKFPGYIAIIFPTSGLGWGRADIQNHCPKTALYLCKRLMEEFNYNNLEDLVNSKRF